MPAGPFEYATPDRMPTPAASTRAQPEVARIGFADVTDALGKGLSDFWERPTHYAFLFILYPVIGFVIGFWTSGQNAFHLLYPLAAGFALVGPLAGVGLYELSRLRESGEPVSARHAFNVLRSPALGQILLLGVALAVVFVLWLLVAEAIYRGFYGPDVPADFMVWLGAVLTTPEGWAFILVGNAAGFVFALAVLATTVVAFPMLVDRGGSAGEAVSVSVRAVARNPAPMLAWGAIVAGALILGALPLLVGLAVVMPVLGHATWHLYRAVVRS